jgi:hypothetical protein
MNRIELEEAAGGASEYGVRRQSEATTALWLSGQGP